MARKPSSVSERIEKLFLSNLGKKLTREQIIAAAKDPLTGREPENWHQRLSELRTDKGYFIRTNRDDKTLKPGQAMSDRDKRAAYEFLKKYFGGV